MKQEKRSLKVRRTSDRKVAEPKLQRRTCTQKNELPRVHSVFSGQHLKKEQRVQYSSAKATIAKGPAETNAPIFEISFQPLAAENDGFE